MLFSLRGLNALVTGATGGIGKEIVKALAQQGANVVISGTREVALKELADEVMSDCDSKIEVIQCNLSNIDEASGLIAKAVELVGQIDILVNNAGINKDKLLMKMSIDDFDEVLSINLRSTFLLSKEAVLHMARNKFGRIINISSVVAFIGNPGQVNYCASKGGLVSMGKAIALEYAKRGITVNCIAPGAIKSPMTDALPEAARERFISKIPVGTIGTPENIAHAVCFLASRESSYITGQTIHVNGGMFIS